MRLSTAGRGRRSAVALAVSAVMVLSPAIANAQVVACSTNGAAGLYQTEGPYTVVEPPCWELTTTLETGNTRITSVKVRYPQNPGGLKPVVMFSHGGGPKTSTCSQSPQFGNSEWGNALATAGFVVVHISHIDNSGTGTGALTDKNWACGQVGLADGCAQYFSMTYLRAYDADVVYEILAAIRDHYGLGSIMDVTKVGMGGHSEGANTTQNMMGARTNLGNLNQALLTNLYNPGAAAPDFKVFLLNSPQGPGGDNEFYYVSATNNSWKDVLKPVVVNTGKADNTDVNYQNRLLVYDYLPTPDKHKMFINAGGLNGADHETFNLKPPASKPQYADWVKSSGIPFMDAYLKSGTRSTAAFTYLNSRSLALQSNQVAQTSCKNVAP